MEASEPRGRVLVATETEDSERRPLSMCCSSMWEGWWIQRSGGTSLPDALIGFTGDLYLVQAQVGEWVIEQVSE